MNSRNRTLEEVEHVYSEDGKIEGSYGILQSILQLRQTCNYGDNVLLNVSENGTSVTLQAAPHFFVFHNAKCAAKVWRYKCSSLSPLQHYVCMFYALYVLLLGRNPFL